MVFPDPFYWLWPPDEAVRDKVPGICNPSQGPSTIEAARFAEAQIQGRLHATAAPFAPPSLLQRHMTPIIDLMRVYSELLYRSIAPATRIWRAVNDIALQLPRRGAPGIPCLTLQLPARWTAQDHPLECGSSPPSLNASPLPPLLTTTHRY